MGERLKDSDSQRQRSSKRRTRKSQGGDNVDSSLRHSTTYPHIQPATRLPPPLASESGEPSAGHEPTCRVSPNDDKSSTLSYGLSLPCSTVAQPNIQLPLDARQTSFHAMEPSNTNVTSVPNEVSGSSPATVGYIGDSGFLSIFGQEHRMIANTEAGQNQTVAANAELPPVELQQSFAETYLDLCWPWCPVFDKGGLWSRIGAPNSPLLINALALLGTHLQPPLTQHALAAEYYDRAKMLFYTDQEKNPVICLQAITLFYWWAPRGPSTVHKDAAWWWTGLAIKYAQQMGLHREPRSVEDVGGAQAQAIRRRVWWTLFVSRSISQVLTMRRLTLEAGSRTFDSYLPRSAMHHRSSRLQRAGAVVGRFLCIW